MAYDGSIKLYTDISTKKAEAQLLTLQNKLVKATDKVEALKNEIEQLENTKIPTEEFADLQKTLHENQTALATVTDRMEKFQALGGNVNSKAFKSMQYDADQLQQKISAVREEMKRLETSGQAYTSNATKIAELNRELESAQKDAQAAALRVEAFEMQLDAASNNANQTTSALDRVKAATSRVGSAINSLASKFKSLASTLGSKLVNGFKSLVSRIKSTNSATGKLNRSFGSSLKTMLKYGLGIRSLYTLFNKLRSAVKEGFENLAQYSGDTNTAISSMQSALSQLKNSLATAFTPILEYIAPALTTMINLLSSAATQVARLMAALTGKSTYVKATKVQEDYAASLSDTASAADDASGALASFDDLEVLNSSSSSGSGSDATTAFETEEIEPISFDSWGEAFSAFLDYLLEEGIPALQNALTSAAGWINDFADNLYEMFTFDGVREKVQTLGAEIADAFNDFTNLINWNTVGSALGAGFDLAIQFLKNLIWTYDWKNLGDSLATAFNGFISNMDWYSFGQLLWSKFKIALETLAGFFENLDMAEVASSASNIVIGIFDSITETIQNIDWAQIGSQIVTFIENIDWAGLVTSIATTIGAAVAAIFQFVQGLIGTAWDSLTTWLVENGFETGEFTIMGLLEGMLNIASGIVSWLYENVFSPIIEGFCSMFGIASPSTVMYEMGTYLMQGLINGITSLVNTLINKFKDIKTNITSVWTALVTSTTTMWNKIVSTIKSAINSVIGAVNGMISGAASGINAVIDMLNTLSFDIPSWVPVYGGSHFGFSIAHVSAPSIPYLAQGAVIEGANPFLAVLGDQRAGQTNIETPLATMIDAFNAAMDARDSGNQSAVINLWVDGKRFAQVTLDNFIDEANRRGGIDVDLVGGTA